MAFKLALTAGHYLYTAGKRCLKSIDKNETREWWLNDRIVDRIQALLSEYDGIEILRTDDTTGQTEVELETRVNKANNFKADFYLSVHHNAGANGTAAGGITAYVCENCSTASSDWQKALYNELISLTGLKGNRVSPLYKHNLYEVKYTSMPAVLLELGFMDSTTDVPVILTQEFANQCAQACVNIIVKKAGLKKKETTTVVGTAYKVVTDINRYSSVADAKSKTNSKGKYTAGTYYIYNKYPNGSSGMLNISTDKTGASAGSWINPAENVVKEPEDAVQKLYRVRTSWTDSKSQKGAFAELANAKECCQNAGTGYKVFDWDGKEVYVYTAPATTTPTGTKKEDAVVKKAVYELDFPEKHQIVDYDITQTEGINEEDCTRAIVSIKKSNSNFDPEIAKAFFFIADEYHIDPMRAISQSVLETGWFKYAGSAVTADQHNYCGLGVTSNGIKGASFDTIENGVRAQLQHLYAYGCKDALPDGETLVDPRFKYVTRGIATYWEQLAGRWAVPGFDGTDAEASMKAGTTYGQKIDKIYKTLITTVVTESDIKKYFVTDDYEATPERGPETTQPESSDEQVKQEVDVTPADPATPEVEPETPKVEVEPEADTEKGIDTVKVNFILGIIEKILKAIINFFSKK